MNDEVNLKNAILLVSDSYGVYIPQTFAEWFEFDELGLSEAFRSDYEAIQTEPDISWYWDAWDVILANAILTGQHKHNKGKQYRLYQDGDLWAIPVEEV